MNRHETTQGVLWLEGIAQHCKTESANLKAVLAAAAKVEYEREGTAPTWRSDLATISASISHQSVYVSNPKAFLDWVTETYPDEVETITQVRPGFQTAFLGGLSPELGRVFDDHGDPIPGVSVRPGGDFLGVTVRPTAAAKQVYSAVARTALERLAVEAGPAVPVVLAELGSGDA